MSEHFVKYINIEKYKCFEGFSAEGFKRVNLISGKNNVGKTALMESVYINVDSENVNALVAVLDYVNYLRNKLDNAGKVMSSKKRSEELKENTGVVRCQTNINDISFGFDDSGIVRNYELTVNNNSSVISSSDMEVASIVANSPIAKNPICYIGSVRDSQENIIHSFTAIQTRDSESEVFEFIKKFDDSIENVKIIGGGSIQCKVIKPDGGFMYRPISEFGDGLRHYLSVIADLFAAENSYVFIDELDNGIHYSSLDLLWKIILTLSKKLNVQVFATTHSKECIESYCRVAEKLEDEDISFITLVKNKEKEIKAIVRDYEMFTSTIHSDREVRGW